MPTKKKYRAGVIGAGAIAQEWHMPGYAKNSHAELIAFAAYKSSNTGRRIAIK